MSKIRLYWIVVLVRLVVINFFVFVCLCRGIFFDVILLLPGFRFAAGLVLFGLMLTELCCGVEKDMVAVAVGGAGLLCLVFL